MEKLTIAIDFDGTLCIGNNFPLIGEPRLWLIEIVRKLKQDGHKLILWTCRENHGGAYYENKNYLDEAVAWCSSHGIEFDAVNQNINEAKYPNVKFCRKIACDWYIDDKAIIFNDTNETLIASINKLGVYTPTVLISELTNAGAQND